MEDRDLFDKFLTGMVHIVRPFTNIRSSSPVFPHENKPEVFVTNENIDTLIAGKSEDQPIKSIGIELGSRNDEAPRAKFNEARFDQNKFE